MPDAPKPLPNGKEGFPPGHFYNDRKPGTPQRVTVRSDAWTPPTYYVHGYVSGFDPEVGVTTPVLIRHYDPTTHAVVREERVELDGPRQFPRPAGTYISVKTEGDSAVTVDADKDFGG